MTSKISILIAFIFLAGCFPFADGDTEYINDSRYYIHGEPGVNKKVYHLGFEDKEWGGIGLVDDPVTALSYTDSYIFVKRGHQKPEFYIVRIINTEMHSEALDNVFGPLDSLKFSRELNNYNISGFKWTTDLDDVTDANIIYDRMR